MRATRSLFLLLLVPFTLGVVPKIICPDDVVVNTPIELKIGYTLNSPSTIRDPTLYDVYMNSVGAFALWASNKTFCLDNGDQFVFSFVGKEDINTKETIQQNVEDLISVENVNYILGGFGTLPTLYAQEITELEQVLLLGTSITTPKFSSHYSLSSFPSSSSRIKAMIPMYRVAGVKNVTMVLPAMDDMDGYRVAADICYGVKETLTRSFVNKIDDVYYSTASLESPDILENITTVADTIQEIDNDLVIYCGIKFDVIETLLARFRENDYIPRGIMAGGIQERKFEDNGLFVSTSSVVARREFEFSEGYYIKSTDEFDLLYTEAGGELDPALRHTFGHFIVAACELLLFGIEKSQAFDTPTLAHAIRTSTFNSFVGEFTFTAEGYNMYPGISLQGTYTHSNIIGPYSIVNATVIYPIPTWDERYEHNTLSGIEIAVIVILCIAILNSVGWIVYTVINRNEKKIIASSPLFLGCMLSGSIIIYTSLFFWMPNLRSNAACSIHVGLLMWGFMFLFGSMVVKTWRVHMLFSNKTLRVFNISNTQVALLLAILLGVDIALFLAWSLVTRPHLEAQIPDMDRPSTTYYTCTTNKTGTALIWTIIGYNGLLFLYGAYLALRVRRIPFKLYDESKIIAFCIYNLGLVAIVVSIIEAAGPASRLVQFAIRSFLIILSTAISINTMFIGKVNSINRKDAFSTGSGNTDSGMTKMHTVKENEAAEVDWERMAEKLRKEKKKLKKEIKELQEALDAFKESAS